MARISIANATVKRQNGKRVANKLGFCSRCSIILTF